MHLIERSNRKKKILDSTLENATCDFFKLHWNERELGQPPNWDGVWHFKGKVPNHSTPGCYALLSSGEVIYIGVGAGKGSGRYKDFGLGARISKYWKLSSENKSKETKDWLYKPVKKWAERGVDSILTIRFPREVGYLAYALEAYLRARLTPIYNKV